VPLFLHGLPCGVVVALFFAFREAPSNHQSQNTEHERRRRRRGERQERQEIEIGETTEFFVDLVCCVYVSFVLLLCLSISLFLFNWAACMSLLCVAYTYTHTQTSSSPSMQHAAPSQQQAGAAA
jgi:hypothetical protein